MMKKFALLSLLAVVWLVTSAQTLDGLLEQAENKLIKLLALTGQLPKAQGGIAERINGGLTQLLANPMPVPQQPSDVVCVPLVDCSPTIQKAIDAAADGAVITTNAGQFVLATPIRIYKPLHLRGSGKFQTVFTHKVNIGRGGSSGIIHTGKDNPDATMNVDGITISDMTLRADRAANPDLRTVAIRIRSRTNNVVIRDVHFQDITSSCVLINTWNSKNIAIVNNTAHEYYEQFVEIAAQFTSDILIAGNTVVTTRGHPKLGSTEPFPVAITPGHAGNGSGLVERVWIVNNVFDHKMVDWLAAGNTVGVMLSEDQASRGYQFGFNDIYVIGNKMRGQGRGVKVQLFRTALMPTTPSAYIAIEQNEFANMVTEPIAIQKTGATINDFVLIGRNVTRLRESWPAYKLDTTATLVKYRIQCIHPSNPTSAYNCN